MEWDKCLENDAEVTVQGSPSQIPPKPKEPSTKGDHRANGKAGSFPTVYSAQRCLFCPCPEVKFFLAKATEGEKEEEQEEEEEEEEELGWHSQRPVCSIAKMSLSACLHTHTHLAKTNEQEGTDSTEARSPKGDTGVLCCDTLCLSLSLSFSLSLLLSLSLYIYIQWTTGIQTIQTSLESFVC